MVRVDPEKPSKGLVSRMGQLRGGGEKQEEQEMNILNTSKTKTIKTPYIHNSKLYMFCGSWGCLMGEVVPLLRG